MELLHWLTMSPQWMSSLIIMGACVIFSVGLILIVRHFVHHSVLKPSNDIAGFIFATVGVIYGVMLAFVVIDVWEGYNSAYETSETESAAVILLYRNLNLYPNPVEIEKIIPMLKEYSISVVEKEYPNINAMKWDSKTQASFEAHANYVRFRESLKFVNPHSLHEQAIFNRILQNMDQLTQARISKTLKAKEEIPGVIWFVVIFGACVVMGFVSLFGYEKRNIQIVLSLPLALIIGGIIEVIVAFSYPFVGQVSIHPDGYEYLIEAAGWLK